MKAFLFFIGIFLFVQWNIAWSQDKGVVVSEDFYKHFKGKSIQIDPKTNQKIELDIFCNMRRQGDKITGSFYNLVDEEFYYIQGQFKNSTQFILEQYNDKFYLIGNIEGVFTSANKAKGRWKSADDNSSFVFTFNEEYSNSLKFKNYTDTSVVHIQNNPKNPSCVLSFDYLDPLKYKSNSVVPLISSEIQKRFFGNFNVGGSLEQSIERKKSDLFVEYRNIVERQFKMTKKSMKKIPSSMLQMFNRNSKFTTSIYYNEDGILCMSKDSIEEAGGEAITEGKSFYVFDLNSGNNIKLDDLFFYPKYKEMMTDMFVEKIMLWLGLESKKDLLQRGFFDPEFIKYNNNFYVDRYGIGFFFNAYEIDERYVRTYFTWRELAPLLKETSLVSHLFPKDLEFDPKRTLTPDDIIPVAPVTEDEEGEGDDGFDDGFMPGIFIPGAESDGDEGGVVFPDDDAEEGGVVFPED